MKFGNPLARMMPFIVAAMQSTPTVAPDVQYHGSGGPSGRMVGKRRRLTCRPELPGNRCNFKVTDYVPKHLRQPRHPKFNGKRPAIYSKRQLAWLQSHLLPGGQFDHAGVPA